MKVEDFISVLDLKNTTVVYCDEEGHYLRKVKGGLLYKEIIKIEDGISLYDTPGPGADVYLYVYVREENES